MILARVGLQGLGAGTVILFASSGKNSRLMVFSEDLFFIYLLPPIIFNAGYVLLMQISSICTSLHGNPSVREIEINE